MKSDLPQDQQKWLEAEIAAGRFGVIGEAVEMAIAAQMIAEEDALTCAKRRAEQAHPSFAGGDAFGAADHFGVLHEEIAKLPIPAGHRAELVSRLKARRGGTADAMDWSDVKAELSRPAGT